MFFMKQIETESVVVTAWTRLVSMSHLHDGKQSSDVVERGESTSLEQLWPANVQPSNENLSRRARWQAKVLLASRKPFVWIRWKFNRCRNKPNRTNSRARQWTRNQFIVEQALSRLSSTSTSLGKRSIDRTRFEREWVQLVENDRSFETDSGKNYSVHADVQRRSNPGLRRVHSVSTTNTTKWDLPRSRPTLLQRSTFPVRHFGQSSSNWLFFAFVEL